MIIALVHGALLPVVVAKPGILQDSRSTIDASTDKFGLALYNHGRSVIDGDRHLSARDRGGRRRCAQLDQRQGAAFTPTMFT